MKLLFWLLFYHRSSNNFDDNCWTHIIFAPILANRHTLTYVVRKSREARGSTNYHRSYGLLTYSTLYSHLIFTIFETWCLNQNKTRAKCSQAANVNEADFHLFISLISSYLKRASFWNGSTRHLLTKPLNCQYQLVYLIQIVKKTIHS